MVSVVFRLDNPRDGLFSTEIRGTDSCSQSQTSTLRHTNSIAGKVAGATGIATVVLQHYQGGTVATATTTAAGQYRFDGLVPWVYTLEATDSAGRSSRPVPFNVPRGSDHADFTLDLTVK